MASNQADHILSTAARLALDHGLGALTMRAVASAAGVSSSAIVYHFQTREGLLAAILEHLVQTVAAGRDRLAGAFDDEQCAVAGPAAGVAAILCRVIDEHVSCAAPRRIRQRKACWRGRTSAPLCSGRRCR